MKFSILVVDDEYFICENIRLKIELLEIQEIGEVRTCYSGEEALEICATYKPEIVITDIKMGKMNGIELIQALKQILYPACFIVLSGYDDYEYVRSAFREGVTDYLLKPILTEQLGKMIYQQCETLMNQLNDSKESRNSLVKTSEKIFSLIFKMTDSEEVQEVEQEIVRILTGKDYVFLKISFDKPMIRHTINKFINAIYDFVLGDKETEYACLCAARTEQKIDLLLNAKQMDYNIVNVFVINLLEKLQEYQLGIPAVGMSRIGTSAELFRLNYECENNLSYRMKEGYGKLFCGREKYELSEIPDNLKKSTLNMIDHTDFLAHTNIWKQIERNIIQLDVPTMKRYYNFLTGLIYSGISSQKEDKREIEFPSFYDFPSTEVFIETIKSKILNYSIVAKQHENPTNVIDSIRDYIEQNFTEKIILSEIADQYFISYSHLSKLFRETYGVSFQEYVISKRMVYAEQLLQCQAMSIQEIADAIGYQNVFNFSRAFKKYFGVSPTYYRRK